MPRFGGDAAVVGFVREEKPETLHVGFEPLVEFVKVAALFVFVGEEFNFITGWTGVGVDDVNIGSPVMAACAWQSGPDEDCVRALDRRKGGKIDRFARDIVKGPFAPPFCVPDGGLFVEIAKSADGGECDSVLSRGFLHFEKRLRYVAVKLDKEVGNRNDMGSGSACQFVRVHRIGLIWVSD